VITKPQNVYVMRDVAASGYVAGGNCLWFGKRMDGSFDASTARENLQQRLSFSDDVGAKYRSMLAFPMWESQLSNVMTCMDTTMSVTSRLLPWEVAGTVANGTHTSFPGGEKAFLMYNGLLGLRSIHFGEDMKAAENQDFISQGSTNNALCFLGPHRKYDSFTNSFYSLTPGQGHWGPDAIPGDARYVSMHHCPTSPLFPSPRLQTRVHKRPQTWLPVSVQVASRRVGLAQDGAQQHGLARGRRALADGLCQEVSRARRGAPLETNHTHTHTPTPRIRNRSRQAGGEKVGPFGGTVTGAGGVVVVFLVLYQIL
tara:strand:+ start:1008 stop:1946 length:939 start_codon:yes stop_codon:yes gene_type:complete